MAKELLINGAGGRIGRGVTYETVKLLGEGSANLELRALNEPMGLDALVKSLTSNDPVHGVYDWRVEKVQLSQGPGVRIVRGNVDLSLPFFAEKEPQKIPFEDLGVRMVLECSGFFGDPKELPGENGGKVFLNQGKVERVIETYPSVKTADSVMIMGVNHLSYNPDAHRIISNASCTTKSLAGPLQVLVDNDIEVGPLAMVTIHAETGKELSKLARLVKERDAAIATEEIEQLFRMTTHSTGAAKAAGYVISSLEGKGKMSGMAYRVPTLDGSYANLYFVAKSHGAISVEGINDLMKKAVSNPKYAGRMCVFDGEDAQTKDIVGRRENAMVVVSKTNVQPIAGSFGERNAYLVTLVSGYDNELGSAVDPVLLADFVAKS
ncbi:MAG: glyceraldehyde 3-phosphate dehydrogenase NAD-binding domain-containing protein [archaeon]